MSDPALRARRFGRFTSTLFWFAAPLIGLGSLPTMAAALECPAAHDHATQGALKETPTAIAADRSVLEAKGVAAAPRLVAQLRERHPTASKGEIEDYLITAYCPVVNGRSDVSDEVKRADVAKFRIAVQRYLYP